ncbi:SMP-30/gluconolactonase/LRE family protein [Enemella sp. A6]|uniref:SMP-30/gluconolactonase/LRE family protein n=1 Tax=Enemella sp. A6 TaxID=3440152 RepID=UPI003EB69871
MRNPEVIVSGLTLPEGPRWHQGLLWFSDMHAQCVRAVRADGTPEVTLEMPDACSGLGFFSNGDLAVAAMHTRKVLRWSVAEETLREWADLSDLASWHVNDLTVTETDHVFVGNFGDDTAPPTPCHPANLVVIDPDGRASVAAEDMYFANGIVALPDTLLVAETRSTPPRVTSFRRSGDELSERRVLVEFDRPDRMPDGMAFDGEFLWVASPFSQEILQVTPDGLLDAAHPVDQMPFAVAANDDTVFVCVSDDWVPEVCLSSRSGRILAFRK